MDDAELVGKIRETVEDNEGIERVKDWWKARTLPNVQCRRTEAHPPHQHVNEGPSGGCGLPEWCRGLT